MFRKIFQLFSEKCIIDQLFQNLFLLLFLGQYAYQYTVLAKTLIKFNHSLYLFNTSLWVKACFNFFLCEEHVQIYHVNYRQAFRLFQFSFVQDKMINPCEGYVDFLGIGYQHQGNILHQFIYYNFL